MNSSLVFVLVAVAAVIVIGLFMRRGESGMSPPAEHAPGRERERSRGEDGPADAREDDSDEEFDEDAEAVAITSDGFSFLPDVHAVRIVPPAEGDEGQPWSKSPEEQGGRHRRGEAALSRSLHAGDLTGVRVVRGGEDEAPWRLDTMGRDADYDYWGFETREAAEAAKGLLEARGVVRIGEDEDGRPMPPSREGWDEARRIWEETQSELLMDLPEEPGPPKPE